MTAKLNEMVQYKPAFISLALHQLLFHHSHPDEQVPPNIEDLPSFEGEIKVYYSEIVTYCAPSDLLQSRWLTL